MNKKIRILGIIPARGGSKGIPKKNIVSLRGKPLISYTIHAAKESKLLDACIVSTDDPKIASIARSYGADVPFLRPKRFAKDLSPDIEFLIHGLSWVKRNRGWAPEIVIILQPTSPSRTGKDIDAVIRMMRKNGCDSVRTIVDPSPYNPFKMWYFPKKDGFRILPILPTKHFAQLGTDVPRQLLPKYYIQVGLVYATRAKFIEKGNVWGPKTCGYIVPSEKFIDIDTSKDLKRAGELIKKWT